MIVVCPSCVVRRQQLLPRTSPLQAGFLTNLAIKVLIWPSLKVVQIVLVHCISRSHRLKQIFKMKN